jgi:hypothetical protein
MIIRMLFLVALLLSSARALDISGTILETGTDKPMAGAQVCIAPDLLTCVNANTNGTFRITDSGSVAMPFGGAVRAGRIAVQHGRLFVDLSMVKTCRLEVFGLDGRLIERTGELAGGRAWWPASGTRQPGDGMHIVRFTGDFGQAICKVGTIGGMVVSATGASRVGSFAYQGMAKRAAGPQDTLVIGQNGYETFSYVPANVTETGVTIHLKPFVVAPLTDSVGFVRNDDLKKTAVLDTGAFSLSVTDKSGLTWTLVVPASPFSTKTAISMIPISPSAGSTIQGGVLFEPDGYYFAEPAKLIVTGATTPLAITTFNHNGSNAGLAAYQKTAGPDTINIFHFSGAGGQDAGTYNNQGECTADEAQMKVVMAEKAALLATPVFVPEPPAIRNECYYELDAASDARNKTLIRQYDSLFQLPEAEIIRNFSAIMQRECLVQCATCDQTFSAYLASLAARLQKKINLALDKYTKGQTGVQNNAEKYHALVPALLSAEKSLALLGFETDAEYADIALRLGNWASRLSDEYLRRLRVEHDYAAKRIILPFRLDAELFGVNTGSIDDYYTAMTKALTFLMTITTTYDYTFEGSFPEHAKYEMKTAKFQANYSFSNPLPWQTDYWDSLPGDPYRTYALPCRIIEASACNGGGPTPVPITPQYKGGEELNQAFQLDFNACADSGCSCSDSAFNLKIVNLFYSFFYLSTWTVPETGETVSSTVDFIPYSIINAMSKYRNDMSCPHSDGSECYAFKFTAPINNKVETAVDETCLGTYDDGSGGHTDASLHIVMKHTPQ